MFIIVAGGGRVGYFLVRDLVAKGQEVVMLEIDKTKCELLNEELGNIALCGDACNPVLLETAGIKRADITVSVTGDDEDNLIISQIAKKKFKVPFTVARINNPSNKEIFAQLGVDATVSQTELLRFTIEEAMAYKGVLTTLPFISGLDVEMVEVVIPENSPSANRSLRELPFPKGCMVAMVLRGKDLIIPDGNTALKPDDLVVALAKRENAHSFRRILLGEINNHLQIDFLPPKKI